MAGGISIHAVDIANGYPAAGLRLSLYRIEGVNKVPLLDNARTDDAGKIVAPNTRPGQFEALFYIGDYLKDRGDGDDAFLDVVTYPFGISTPERHHHLPLKFTPFGLSLFLTH